MLVGVDATELSRGLNRASSTVKDFGANLARTGAVLTGAFTVPIVGAGLASLRAAGDLEQATVAFTTLLGSAERAGAFLEELRDFAAQTPFEFVGLRQASQQLLNAGFEAQAIIPLMTAVGDAVASAGGDPQKMEATIRAMTQIQAKGRVMAEEMMQLNEAGTFSWQALADSIGTTVPEAMQKASAGAISAEQFIAAFIENSATRFGGLMEQQSQTLLGMWSTFKDDVTKILTDFGMAILPVAKDMLSALQPILQWAGSMAERFANLDPMLQKVILGFIGLLAAIGPILMVLGGLALVLGALLSPVGLVIAGVAALVAVFVGAGAAFATWVSQNEEAKQQLMVAWNEIQAAVSELRAELEPIIKDLTRFWKEHGDEVLAVVGVVFQQVVAVISGFLRVLTNAVEVFLNLLEGDWRAAWGDLGDIVDAMKDTVVAIVDSLFGLVEERFNEAARNLKKKAEAIRDGVVAPFEMMRDLIVGHSIVPEMWDAVERRTEEGVQEVVRLIRVLPFAAKQPVEDLASILEDMAERAKNAAALVGESMSDLQMVSSDAFDQWLSDTDAAIAESVRLHEAWGNNLVGIADDMTGNSGFFGKMKSNWGDLSTSVGKLFGPGAEGLMGSIGGWASKLAQWAGPAGMIFSSVMAIGDLFGINLKAAIGDALKAIGSAIMDFFAGLGDVIGGFFDWLHGSGGSGGMAAPMIEAWKQQGWVYENGKWVKNEPPVHTVTGMPPPMVYPTPTMPTLSVPAAAVGFDMPEFASPRPVEDMADLAAAFSRSPVATVLPFPGPPAAAAVGFDMSELASVLGSARTPQPVKHVTVIELNGRVIAEETSDFLIEDWRRKGALAF